MKNLKNLILMILAPLAVGALAGCGGGKGQQTDSKQGSSTTSESSQSSQQDPLPNEYSLMKYWAGNPAEEYYDVNENDTQTVITYEDVTGEGAGGWAYVARSFSYDALSIARFSEYQKISFTGKLEKTSGSDVVMVKVEGAGGTFEKKFNFSSTSGTYEFGLNFISDWTQVSSLLFFVNRETKESGSGQITLTKFVLSKEAVNPAYDIAPGMPSVPQDYTIYDGGETLSVMYRWGYDATEFITTSEADGAFTFSWGADKGQNEWAYVSALAKGDDQHIMMSSGFKRVKFTVTGTAGIHALFKFQDKANTKAKEVNVELTGQSQEIEVEAASVLAGAAADEFLLAIFPHPGASGAVAAGSIRLTACVLDKTAVTLPANVANMGSVFLDNYQRADDCYVIENANHVSRIQYTKAAGGYESIQYAVELPETWWNIQDYTRVVGTFVSTADVKVLLKPFDNNANEHLVELTANTPVEVDYTVAAATADIEKNFIMFVGTEGTNLQGTLTVTGLRLAKPTTNIEEGNKIYIANSPTGGDMFAVTPAVDGHGMTIAYTKTAPGWEAVEFLVSALNLAGYRKLHATVTSTVDTHILFKPGDVGANEKNVALTAGTPVEVEYVFNERIDEKWVKSVLFVCIDGADALAGSVTLSDFYFTNDFSGEINTANMGSVFLDNFSFASDCFVVKNNGHVTTIKYDKDAGGWENIQYKVELPESWWNIADYNRVYGKIVADADVKVLLKPFDNGANEHWFNLEAGVEQQIDFTIDGATADLTKAFVIFVGTEGANLHGTVTLTGLRLAKPTTNIEENNKVYITKSPTNDGIHTITSLEDGMEIAYTKTASGWEAIEFLISADDVASYTKLHVKITSTVATHVLLKPGDNNANENNVAVEANAAAVVIDYDLSVPTDAKWVKGVLFVCVDGADALSGTVTLHEFYLYK